MQGSADPANYHPRQPENPGNPEERCSIIEGVTTYVSHFPTLMEKTRLRPAQFCAALRINFSRTG